MIQIPQRHIYLAGPITGLTHGEASEWRRVFMGMMPPWIAGMSPMRDKEHLANKGALSATLEPGMPVHITSRGIFARDKNDVRRCDLLLVNFLGAERVSIGTVAEIAMAHVWRKPIVVAMETTGNPHEHLFIQEMIDWRVTTLGEAARTVKSVLESTPGWKSNDQV